MQSANDDLNRARIDAIRHAAERCGSARVRAHVEVAFVSKIESAGPFAGAWFEAIEPELGRAVLVGESAFAELTPEEFATEFEVVFGYRPRSPKSGRP